MRITVFSPYGQFSIGDSASIRLAQGEFCSADHISSRSAIRGLQMGDGSLFLTTRSVVHTTELRLSERYTEGITG